MNLFELMRLEEQFSLHTSIPFPLSIERGAGAVLYDTDGKSYLDFSGSESVLGYGNEAFAETLLDQALRLGAGPGYHRPSLELSAALCRRSGMSRVCLTDSGSAANEMMITLARQYSFGRYGAGRSVVLTLHDAVHGSSLTALAASGVNCPALAPQDSGFLSVEADIAALRQVQAPVCAVMVELISLEKGVMALSKQFIHELAVLCAERDWLLLIDEVQTGIGRTGCLFAFQQYGILPDAVSFGRSVAGGLPMGGMLVNSRCAGVLQKDDRAARASVNPICAAAGLAVLNALGETELAEIGKKGDYLKSGIETLQLGALGEIRGSGLMLAVDLHGNAADAAARLAEAGFLCHARGGALCLLPPLFITRGEIDTGLSLLKRVLAYDSLPADNSPVEDAMHPAYF